MPQHPAVTDVHPAEREPTPPLQEDRQPLTREGMERVRDDERVTLARR